MTIEDDDTKEIATVYDSYKIKYKPWSILCTHMKLWTVLQHYLHILFRFIEFSFASTMRKIYSLLISNILIS